MEHVEVSVSYLRGKTEIIKEMREIRLKEMKMEMIG